MDRNLLHEITEHVRSVKPGDRDDSGVAKLVDGLRTLARRQANEKLGMYEIMAKDMPAIAQQLGFADFTSHEDATHSARFIDEKLKDIRRGRHVRLIPAFVHWMWQQDANYTRRFLSARGFDLKRWQPDIAADADDTIIAGIQNNSAYRLERVLALAHSRLILIAQNHWHMVSPPNRQTADYWPQVAQALQRGVNIEIVAMHHLIGPLGAQRDPQEPMMHPDAALLWGYHCNAPWFSRQLDDFWNTMEEWDRRYRELQVDATALGSLTILGAYFTPLTMTVIDPDEPGATLILSPRTPDQKSTMRPQFVVRKAIHPDTFAYYYGDIAHALSDHHWVTMYG